ncbi:MAG TPA: MFS transporter [Verrucomicrobiae bacterium]|nr:MFS transporter [Verrucomicrobiae bacterium]
MSAPSVAPEAPETPWPSPLRAWWVLVVFFITAIVYYTDRLILNLLVDPIRAELLLSDTQISLLQGVAFALVYAFAGLPLGRVADLMPRRTVMIVGVIVWSAATVACGFANSFTELFAARMLVGIGEAALAPAAVSMICDYFPPHRRGTAFAVFMTGMSVGSSLSIVVGGGLLEAANSGWFASIPGIAALSPWRAALVLLALPSLLIVGLLLTVREPVRRGSTQPNGAKIPLREAVQRLSERRQILIPLYLAVAMVSVGDVALQNWTPTLLSRRFEYSPGEIAAILGGVALIMGIIGSLFGGVFADYLYNRGGSRARLAAACVTTLLAVGGSLIALASNGLSAVAIFALWSFMASISGAIGITTIQAVVPDEIRGIGTSLVSFGNILLGMGLGATLPALFTDYVYGDPLAVGWSITTIAGPAGLLAAFLFWRARQAFKK